MEQFDYTEPDLKSLKCSYCTNPNSLVGLCQKYHYVCCECQRAFPNCPICAEPYLPQDDFLLDTILGPLNETKQIILSNTDHIGNPLITAKQGRAKKSPVEKCKEHFFLSIWEALTGLIFSGLTKKGKKNVLPTESISKILSKVTRKMGRSVYDWVLSKNPDRQTLQVSLGLLALLIGGQLVLQRALKGSSDSIPTIIKIPGVKSS